jgi:hypothetical protein
VVALKRLGWAAMLLLGLAFSGAGGGAVIASVQDWGMFMKGAITLAMGIAFAWWAYESLNS